MGSITVTVRVFRIHGSPSRKAHQLGGLNINFLAKCSNFITAALR